MSSTGEFVKSATTTTPVAKSQSEIMAILARYNASGFGFRKRANVVSVTFHLAKSNGVIGDDHEVEIPIDLERVREKLNAPGLARARAHNKQAREVSPDQVERVAWRLLVLWLDAALAAVSLGAQTIEDAFFAHVVVRDSEGNRGRAADYFATLEKLGRGTVPALQSGAWTEVAANRRLGPGAGK